ncbi:AMP-binding protein [Flagellatimonas centrodinii]|uniref:AMP-binding protein n=1 Tax=Flagellatimonas centrodinii TaxID=2806210 RepID=UPI001FEFB6F8|nr:AMP-binding protein [Flagellatimonas centrodinii]ULQ45508.1 AMP-binding protein [Flagellatimonas centrodinii]
MTTQKNPIEMLLHWAQERPDTPWLFQPVNGQWQPITWSQAEAQVRTMAAALKGLGFPPGSAIAISGRNTAHWFLADLAIAMAGYISVGLYPKQAESAVTYILKHCEAKAIFIGPMPDPQEFAPGLPDGIVKIAMPYPDLGIDCDHQWDALLAGAKPLQGYTPPDPSALVTLVYTSGTTGNPKGVMINGENMLFAAQGMNKAMPAEGQERFFSYLPLAHAFERGAVELGSLFFGAQVYFLEHIDKLAEQLAEVAPTRFFGVPLVFSRIQAGVLKKMPQAKLDRLLKIPLLSGLIRKKIKTAIGLQNARYLFVGAAPMPIPLIEWFDKLGIKVLQGYGMTENNIYATANLPKANRWGSVGRAQPGANMRIAADGEIQFKHPAVMAGYYKAPDKTAETFTEDGWLRTGDRGRIDEDGYLFITGRVKDIFKTLKGKYVAPAPIEGAMARNTLIDQLCLVGSGLKQPILLVSLNDAGRAMSREDAGQALVADVEAVNQPLEAHEQIAKVVVVKDLWTIDNGLMTPTMKVKRNEVESRYAALIEKQCGDREKLGWEA